MKTLIRLYENGNLETLGVDLIEMGSQYIFSENSIIVPKLIELPPLGYRNYFIEKDSVPGWLDYDGILSVANEFDRASDFIDVTGWGEVTIRVRFSGVTSNSRAWANVCFYDINKVFINSPFDDYVGQLGENVVWEIKLSPNTTFIRISANYFDDVRMDVKASVERGNTTNQKHYLAPEDLPDWVVDTGNPVSFFKEGIVIKGELIIN